MDWQENGAESHKDSVHNLSSNHIFTSQIGQYQNTSLSSAESHSENLFKNLLSKSSSQRDLLKDSPEDFRLKAPSGKISDPFRPSSNTAEDLFGSPKDPAGNPFDSSSSTASHWFQANGGKFSPDDKLAYSGLSGSDLDVFSPSSNFSSSIVKELFGDGGSTSDLFHPEAPDGRDVFGSLPRSGLTKSTPDLSEQTFQSAYSDGPRDVVLTTPQGSKHGILRPTPFSQAQKLSASSDSSPTESNHVRSVCCFAI